MTYIQDIDVNSLIENEGDLEIFLMYDTDDNIEKINMIWNKFKMVLNKDEVKLVDSKHVYEPGRVLTFDKRGKCKELNVEIYDELGNRYELEWYKNIRADNIWNIWDDGWEHDPNPLPKILDIISSVPPTYVTIYI